MKLYYICTNSVPRKTTWLGYIGLMYPSDYGYSIEKEKIEYKTCIEDASYNDWSECGENSWLYMPMYYQYTMMPTAYSSQNNVVFGILKNGSIVSRNAYYSWNQYPYSIRPTLYLKSNIKITSGNGTKENSYKLEF